MNDTIAAKVEEHDKALERHEKTLQRHETILVGVEDCEDNGLVEQTKTMRMAIDQLVKASAVQATYNKILLFFATALGAAVIAFIWSIITHAVTIMRP